MKADDCVCESIYDYSMLLTVTSLGFLFLICLSTLVILSYNKIHRNIDAYNWTKPIKGVYFMKIPVQCDIDLLQKEYNSKLKVSVKN